MTDDSPTPADKQEKSDRFRRILNQPEEGGVPPFDDFDLPEAPPFEGAADGETLIFDINEPDPRRVVGTDTLPLQEPAPAPAAVEPEPPASDTQPMRVRRAPSQPSQGSAAGYRPTGSGNTPPQSPPAVDANGMPLPRRVDEIDVDATRVSAVAYTRARQAPERSGTPSPAQAPAPWHFSRSTSATKGSSST